MAAKRSSLKASAILKAMTPLGAGEPGVDPKVRQRRLLADLCRLIGAHIDGAEGKLPVSVAASFGRPMPIHDRDLSPRERETLQSLLAGDSEKQAAMKLGLSQHTVHVYVKKLYRKFGVCSRGELLAKWVRN